MFFAVFHCLQEFGNLKEIPILNGLGDPGQLLIHDAARAHVQMSYLGVAHLAVRKSHRQAAGLSLDVGALAHQLVHDRSLALTDRVGLTGVVETVTIEDH